MLTRNLFAVADFLVQFTADKDTIAKQDLVGRGRPNNFPLVTIRPITKTMPHSRGGLLALAVP